MNVVMDQSDLLSSTSYWDRGRPRPPALEGRAVFLLPNSFPTFAGEGARGPS
jgi:hypothetical protein